MLAIAKRWIQASWLKGLTFLAGMGYAIPGTVLALALLFAGTPWQLSPIILLLWGYSDRFLAVSKGGSMQRSNASIHHWMRPPLGWDSIGSKC